MTSSQGAQLLWVRS